MNFEIRSFIGGMNSDVAGLLINDNQYQRGVNVSSRGGSSRTRPFLKEFDVSLADGLFQGSAIYSLESADRLVFAIAGHIYTYNFATDTLTQVTGAATRLDQTTPVFWFCQAEQYMVVQDGINIPIILNYNGTNPDICRRAKRVANGDAVNEVPIGTVMAYGHGRICVALRELGGSSTTERFFAVGDIMLPTSPETVLQFTETDYLSEGGAFALPNELGLIHGMAFLRNQTSGNGLGSLIVFARNGASTFKLNAPRGTWKDIDISDVLFTNQNAGTFADKSIVAVNNDLIYRSIDGIRTIGYNIAKSHQGTASPSNDSVSRTVDKELSADAIDDHGYCYGAAANNRVYFLTQDTELDSGEHGYRAMITLDAAILSIYGKTPEPAFDGLWTGLIFSSIHSARIDNSIQLVVSAKTSEGGNKLYYLDESTTAYTDGDDSSPVCRIYTGAIDARMLVRQRLDEPVLFMKFEYAEIWASDILGTTGFTVYYRPYGHNLWLSCLSGTVCFNPDGKPGFTHGMRFQAGTDVTGENIEVNLNIAKAFEFCIEWEGKARIDLINIEMSRHDSGVNAACDNDGTCVTITAGEDGDEIDDFAYSIT